jgi:hypothetical protein
MQRLDNNFDSYDNHDLFAEDSKKASLGDLICCMGQETYYGYADEDTARFITEIRQSRLEDRSYYMS